MQEKFEERESVVLEHKGQKVFGVLHIPVGVESAPAVLICHGLAGHKTGKYRLYVALATRLAQSGIAALRLDFRGSGDSEGEFHEMTLTTCVEDAALGLEFLKNHKNIDVNRIGVFGRSFGGSIAIMAASRFSKVKSIALWAPVFTADPWRELWELVKSGKLDNKQKEKVMTINGQVPSLSFYAEFFGMNLEKDLEELRTVPVLHIHGERDQLIDIKHADSYVKHRKEAHAKTKFVRLPEADHDFSIADDQKTALEITTQWFQETLLTRGEKWQLFWKNFGWLTLPNYLQFWKLFKS